MLVDHRKVFCVEFSTVRHRLVAHRGPEEGIHHLEEEGDC